jgi:hypothetical protein
VFDGLNHLFTHVYGYLHPKTAATTFWTYIAIVEVALMLNHQTKPLLRASVHFRFKDTKWIPSNRVDTQGIPMVCWSQEKVIQQSVKPERRPKLMKLEPSDLPSTPSVPETPSSSELYGTEEPLYPDFDCLDTEDSFNF